MADLIALLNSTELAQKQPRLYQLLQDMITRLKPVATSSGSLITFIPIDTSASAQTLVMSNLVKGFTIFKDQSGNALVNNITLIGDVEGVTDPVINTNYGMLRVVSTSVGLLQW